MKTNIDTIGELVDYIDSHLDETLHLEAIARAMNYSKYHLSRMFVSVVGFTVHSYIQRRRLTEAARLLVSTDKPIIEIALLAGYQTQQSFTLGFRALFKSTPQAFRRKKNFYPVQLKFVVDGVERLRGDRMMDIRTVEQEKMTLVGYRKNTRFGFFVIGSCWRKLHANKHLVQPRKEMEFLIGLNDYTKWDSEKEKQPAFDYLAAAEVGKLQAVPKGMETKELPASRYVVFSFRGRCQDSLQPVADYVYKEWFPQASCQLNEDARYDFAKYGEQADKDGNSLIEYWVPIR